MGSAVSIDGALVNPESASVPVLDRGFLYGDSAFEVTRTYAGQPFALGLHLERLRHSCAQLSIPVDVDDATLRREVHEVLAAAGNTDAGAESYVRVVVTRGVTALGLSLEGELRPRRVMVAAPLKVHDPKLWEEGGALATVSISRSLDGTGASGVKASNYLPNILSLAAAHRRGAYEAISVGGGGELLEGSTSNLFLVHDGEVSTPPLEVGILGGITRRLVMEAAAEDGAAIRERLLFPPDLYSADEAFITSSTREVVPMVRADGVTLGGGRPGPVTQRLHAAFRRRADALLAEERV
ncbi:MAG: aminotransferase class IV [Sandaracinaceae bacterium]|nr:MAG: aminotransferase [Sandaracinaceae bacterium]HBQ14127.1 aminotransferase [Myxococcales bacterium]